jgi:hypothetical protein
MAVAEPIPMAKAAITRSATALSLFHDRNACTIDVIIRG